MHEYEISLRPHNAVSVAIAAMTIFSGERSFKEFTKFIRTRPEEYNERVLDLVTDVVGELIENPGRTVRIIPYGDISGDILCVRCRHHEREQQDSIGTFFQDVLGGLGLKPGVYIGENLFQIIAKRKHFKKFVDKQGKEWW